MTPNELREHVLANPSLKTTREKDDTDNLYRELTGRNPVNRNYWPDNKPVVAAKVDRSTFNYGRALGAPRSELRAEYHALQDQARAWQAIASQFSRAAWALEMTLKATRDAETQEEQERGMVEARKAFHAGDKALERIEARPCKWFRYGRIGNVLKSFAPSWTSRHNG